MSKGLIITEKPSVTRDIVEALGGFSEAANGAYFESDAYICTFAVGHILEHLDPEDYDPNLKRWKLADLPIVPREFAKKPVASHADRVKIIQKLMMRADVTSLINACDAAREGELIFRELVSYAGCTKPIRRLWLQSMTKKAIHLGFSDLQDGALYDGLGKAAECRARADWLIGMNATRALTIRLRTRNERGASWSVGRVQTPTLALLVERELRVLSHQPQSYWKIHGSFKAADHTYDATWYDPSFKRPSKETEEFSQERDDRIFDLAVAEKVLAGVRGKDAIASESRKAQVSKAPLLFDLTTLQKTANSRFGWPAVRTLRAAQRLYETHKVLTYPRTSSRVLPSDYVEEVNRIIGQLAAVPELASHCENLQARGLLNQEKVFDDAGVSDHFAIIPTGEVRVLEGDDARLFDLVSRQFLAAFYPPAIYEVVERTTVVGSHYFRSRPPKLLKEAGWMILFQDEKKTPEAPFPPLKAGEDKVEGVGVAVLNAASEALETKPPARIGEAGLLGLMENAGRSVDDEELASVLKKTEGLGTAATRADIIENLKRKEYVDANLRPTTKGIRLIDVLQRLNAARLTSALLTAEIELHLNEVENGSRDEQAFINEIVAYTEDVVRAARDLNFDTLYPAVDPLGPCPKCQRLVYERAWFYGCEEATKQEGARGCDFLIWKDFNSRYIDRNTATTLLLKRETLPLDGFLSAAGNPYRAKLILDGGTITREFLDAEAGAPGTVEINPEPLGVCPTHGDSGCLIVESLTEFSCQQRLQAKAEGERDAPGFSCPRFLCKREMRRDEVVMLMQTGTTEVYPDFVSKKGRKFRARLVLDDSRSSFSFAFPERAPRAEAAEAAAPIPDGN